MKTIKSWTITEEVDDEGKSWIKRVNDGFSAYELLGIAEHTKLDLIEQIQHKINPERVIRQVIVNKEEQK